MKKLPKLEDPKKFFKKKEPKNESENFSSQILKNNIEKRKSIVRRKEGY